MPIITIISLLRARPAALGRRALSTARANPVPSKTSHNTLIEVIWTLVPVLILVGIAIPSIGLLAKQYKPAPAKALTIKVTGNQWYWAYAYPDNGDFEVISNMLPEEEAAASAASRRPRSPSTTAWSCRSGEPIRLQITGADVIHAFAVPSLLVQDRRRSRPHQRDACCSVEKPGVYYGQCSELCGARHGYMPIAVEARAARRSSTPGCSLSRAARSTGRRRLPPAPAAGCRAAAGAAQPPAAADRAAPAPRRRRRRRPPAA